MSARAGAVLHESGLAFQPMLAPTKTHPLGYVPLLELDDGTVARAQLQPWFNFISIEIHKGFSPLINPATPAEYQPLAIDRLLSRLKWVDSQLAGRHHLMGEAFSVADPYLLP